MQYARSWWLKTVITVTPKVSPALGVLDPSLAGGQAGRWSLAYGNTSISRDLAAVSPSFHWTGRYPQPFWRYRGPVVWRDRIPCSHPHFHPFSLSKFVKQSILRDLFHLGLEDQPRQQAARLSSTSAVATSLAQGVASDHLTTIASTPQNTL